MACFLMKINPSIYLVFMILDFKILTTPFCRTVLEKCPVFEGLCFIKLWLVNVLFFIRATFTFKVATLFGPGPGTRSKVLPMLRDVNNKKSDIRFTFSNQPSYSWRFYQLCFRAFEFEYVCNQNCKRNV